MSISVSIRGEQTAHSFTLSPAAVSRVLCSYSYSKEDRILDFTAIKGILGPVSMEQSLRRGFNIDLSTRLIEK